MEFIGIFFHLNSLLNFIYASDFPVYLMGIIGSLVPSAGIYLTKTYSSTLKGNTFISGSGTSSKPYSFGFSSGVTIGTMSCPLGIKAITVTIDNFASSYPPPSKTIYITKAGSYSITLSNSGCKADLKIEISGSIMTIKANSTCFASTDRNSAGTSTYSWTSANGYSASSADCYMKILVEVDA